MKSKKKKQANPDIIVGDVTKKIAQPEVAEPPYLGAPQTGMSKRNKIILAGLLSVLVIVSAAWLVINRQDTSDGQDVILDSSEFKDTGKPIEGYKEKKQDVSEYDSTRL